MMKTSEERRMDPNEIIQSQADAARGILEKFGAEKALGYLIGEKFLNFLEAAETDRHWRQAIPAIPAPRAVAKQSLSRSISLSTGPGSSPRFERRFSGGR